MLLLALSNTLSAQQIIKLQAASSPADNPLKGLVPYASADVDRFPHSLEFFYIPLNKLMVGPSEFDWQPLEDELNTVAERGCQAVFRVWIEYPGQASGLPEFLSKQGVKVTNWINNEEKPPRVRRLRIMKTND